MTNSKRNLPAQSKSSERDLYEQVRTALAGPLSKLSKAFYLEVTADKGFSNELKKNVPSDRDIVFSFLRDNRPDITGYVQAAFAGKKLIVVEVKSTAPKLDDIYQVRRYAELLGAPYALLVATEEPSQELKRLCKVVSQVLELPNWKKVTVARFDPARGRSAIGFREIRSAGRCSEGS